MSDIQNFMHMLFAQMSKERESKWARLGAMTLGDLRYTLSQLPIEHKLYGIDPNSAHSYRGYYEYIAFEPSETSCTVGDLLAAINSAIGKEFTGYKGGEFLMTSNTYVFIAYYGNSSGIMILGLTDSNQLLFKEVSDEE